MTLEQKLKHYRLTKKEYELMKSHLGHEPENLEWAVYSALWSEHCSYKSSKIHLRKLFTKHSRVVQGPGENAGVIDIGKGEKVCFKMESHNHPSFIEPFQGAATGVGGILRDIFTMGARPIAVMDSLFFGEPENKKTPHLFSGVVRGVSSYGNCVGVPNLGGQTVFHERYNSNILVNAYALGFYGKNDKVFYGRASGHGNMIVYAGARTGRDGVHGASMASESFSDDLGAKKPNVQIGDPFFEKLLIEACLEVMNQDLVVGIQDMGAAGLTSSTFEMASRAQMGLRIDLKRVPLREPDITPEEIMLSESQERMILIVEEKKFEQVKEVFSDWDLDCTVIGEVVEGNHVSLFWGPQLLARIDHRPLVDGAPVYERPYELPKAKKPVQITSQRDELKETALQMLNCPELGSRKWLTGQYDSTVGARTVSGHEDGVGILYLRDSKRLLGMAAGCRPLLMEFDVANGSLDAVVLPSLQLASRGIKPLAVTDCLNFGNPENPTVMGEFVQSMQCMDEACRKLDIPIISGNVSLYNETLSKGIIPTPSTVIVGVSETDKIINHQFKSAGHSVYLVKTKSETTWLGEYNHALKRPLEGSAQINLDECEKMVEVFLKASNYAESSQVVSRFGLFNALWKLSSGGIGARIELKANPGFMHEELFAERFYASLWAVNPVKEDLFEKTLKEEDTWISCEKIGVTGGNNITVNENLAWSLVELAESYDSGLKGILEKLA